MLLTNEKIPIMIVPARKEPPQQHFSKIIAILQKQTT
jgi:hypothetical protein